MVQVHLYNMFYSNYINDTSSCVATCLSCCVHAFRARAHASRALRCSAPAFLRLYNNKLLDLIICYILVYMNTLLSASVLYFVFRYFHVDGLLRLSRVCKLFHDTAHQKALWNQV